MRRPLASGQIKLGSFGIHYRNSETALLGIRLSLNSKLRSIRILTSKSPVTDLPSATGGHLPGL